MNLIKLKYLLSIAILLIFCRGVSAQETVPSQNEIKRIEDRGKQIANYERAAIRATDLMLTSNPDKSKLEVYVAVNQNNRWMVYFGKITDKGFETDYIYSCPDGQFDQMKPEQNDQNISTEAFYFAKAVSLAGDFIAQEMTSPRYNTNVFREQDGTITVYFIPGNKEPDTVILGGDFKVSISNDALKVLNKTKLHTSFLKMPLKEEKGQQTAGAFHTHILGDLPTETDVALIILNPVLAPHYITAQTWMSKINADGQITVLGKSEEILKEDGF